MEILGPHPALSVRSPQSPPPVTARVLHGNVAALRAGEPVSAVVLQSEASGTQLQLAGGRIVLSHVPGAESGQHLSLRLLSRDPQALVEVVRAGGDEAGASSAVRGESSRVVSERASEADLLAKATDLLKQHLPLRRPAGETFAALQQALSRLGKGGEPLPAPILQLRGALQNLAGDPTPAAARYLGLLTDGGMHYESQAARLAEHAPGALPELAGRDLKALLLQALHAAENSSRAGMQELAAAIRAHLAQIESLQLLNALSQPPAAAWQFQIPFLDERNSTVFLYIEPDDQGQGDQPSGERSLRLLLTLEPDSSSRTRIDVLVTGVTIRVLFYAQKNETVARLEAMLPELETSLVDLGFERAFLAAHPLDRLSPELAQKFRRLAAEIPPAVNLVDVRG